METTSSSEMIKKEIFIACRPETLFSFFTDPDKLVRWMGRNVLLDPSIGGKFRIDLNGTDIAIGEYKEITPNEKVVMTWGWERSKAVPPGSSTVEFKLTPKDNGTLLEFIHYDLPATEIADHVKGWSHFLLRIQMVAEGDEAGEVPSSEHA
ncbi:SRPBCC family protein [Paenibacillus sp. MAH-36]|uniref:SRPBCC domain-containing protein n=1 Tax=Paenibacillus violae TaxID=3077234 RepID=A0ABU3REG9_9BACL|nr:SRPBCC domain-containing protein [Paenibacillus sp. PFR10]MDU0202690.1 SRPBCC domain-containing protein [Paenibacillus sp. PFR10]